MLIIKFPFNKTISTFFANKMVTFCFHMHNCQSNNYEHTKQKNPIEMFEQSQSTNLNVLMENAIQPINKNITFISKLKFRNIVYCPGDDIVLQGEQKGKEVYGKIMLIVLVPGIKFPVLLVNWYFNLNDPIIIEQGYIHLSKKELIFSDYSDWQYIESVKRKIRIITIEAYQKLDSYARTDPVIFFRRSYLLAQSPNILNNPPKRACRCLAYYNPDDTFFSCVLCGILCHARCSHANELCINCLYS